MIETTYTVHRNDGTVIERGLSLTEAAAEILSYDGYRYEVRPAMETVTVGEDDNGEDIEEERQVSVGGDLAWQCFASEMSAASSGGSGRMYPISGTYVFAADADQAWQKIAAVVVEECNRWRHSPQVMTDADYDAMMAEAEG